MSEAEIDAEAAAPKRRRFHIPRWVIAVVAVLAIAIAAWLVLHAGKPDLWPRPARIAGKCGLIDRTGKFVLNPQFEAIIVGNDPDLIAAMRDGKWGFIDRTGAFRVAPQFEFAMPPRDGGWPAQASNNRLTGFVGTNGQMIAPRYGEGIRFDGEGLALVTELSASDPTSGVNQPRFIDRTGKVVLALEQYDQAMPFGQSDVARVRERASQKWGLIDRKGSVVLPPRYDQIGGFGAAGVTWFKSGEKYGLISRSLKIVRNSDLDGVFEQDPRTIFFSASPPMPFGASDLLGVKIGSRWGYIDASGTIRIQPQFDGVRDFDDSGRAIVQIGEKWGVIDQQGQYVVNPQYDGIGGFVSGISSVTLADKIGFIDRDGKQIAVPQYTGYWLGAPGEPIAVQVDASSATAWRSGNDGMGRDTGLSRATGRWGFIDRTGKLVIPIQYDDAEAFWSDGFAAVKVGERWGYIGRNGDTLIAPQFESIRCYGATE